MSEKFKQQLESFEAEQRENILPSGETVVKKEAGSEKIKQAPRPEVAAKAVAEAGNETDSSQELLEQLNVSAENQPDTDEQATVIDPKAQAAMAKREIKSIQQQESFSERTLSRVIHQPVVRAVSEVTSKTATRPSGLLGGGLAAFIGSGSYLVLANYLKFTYNYSVSLALFVGGFFAGLLLELAVHLMRRRQANLD